MLDELGQNILTKKSLACKVLFLCFGLIALGCHSPERSALVRAASLGHIDEIKDLLRKGEDINQADSQGKTPLMAAAESHKLQALIYLLDSGASIDKQDNNRWTAMGWASYWGDCESAEILLDRGGNPNVGIPPIMLAVPGNHADMITLLIDHGADINAIDSGETALILAVGMGKTSIVEELLKFNPDLSIKDSKGRTVLEIARDKGDTHLEQILGSASYKSKP